MALIADNWLCWATRAHPALPTYSLPSWAITPEREKE